MKHTVFKLRNIAVSITLLVSALPSFASRPVNSRSLSNLHVYDIAQDSLGYIWVATANGLCRNMGDSYDIFYSDPADATSLPSNNITGLYYKHPFLWIASGRGVAAKDIHSKRFIRYLASSKSDGFFSGFIDFHGDIYAYGFGGIYRINSKKRTLDKIFSSHNTPVNTAAVTEDNEIWLATNQRLTKLNAFFKPIASIRLLKGCLINSILPYKNILYLGTNEGLKSFDPSTGKLSQTIKDAAYAKMVVNSLLRIDADNILVCTRNGGQFFYNIKTGTRSSESHNFNLDDVQDADIAASFIDGENKLWLGTFDRGLLRTHDYKSTFNSDNKLEKAFKGCFVTRIEADNHNRFWVGTRYTGLKVYDRNSGKVISASLPVQNSFIQNIYRDSRNRLWVGYNMNLAVGNLSPGSLVLSNLRTFENIGNVVSAAEDKNGNIWVGTSDNGIFIYGPDLVLKKHLANRLFNSDNITKIVLMPSGEMLVAAYTDGIYVVNPKTYKARPLEIPDRSLCVTAVDLLLDKNNGLWIGTYDNGLVYYDFKTKKTQHYNNFQSHDIVSVNEDNNGNIWLGSSNGLYYINRRKGEIHSYVRGPGLLGAQYHEKSTCRASDGSLYFGGNAGLQQISPGNISDITGKVPVYLTSVVPLYKGFSPNDKIKDAEEAFVDEVTLSHQNSGLSISFGALDYSQPVEYAYMLEGYDKGWVDSGEYTRATYTNLPPGSYRFLVKTQIGGVWSEPVCLLKIHMKEAPWLSPFAIAAYVMLAIILIIVIIRLYIRLKLEKGRIALAEKRAADEKIIATRKINFFQNISHELRTPLTLISSPMKQLQNNFRTMSEEEIDRDLRYMDFNVHRLLTLMTQILKFREVHGETLPLAVSYSDVISQSEQIVSLFNIYAAEKGITIELVCHVKENHLLYDTDKFEKMLNNLLFNAVKYTPDGGHVAVRLDLTRHPECIPNTDGIYLEICVTDDGIKMDVENAHNIFTRFFRIFNASSKIKNAGFGIGLDFVKKIVAIHHGAIVGRPNAVKGMTFIIDLPVEESAYTPEEFYKEESQPVSATGSEDSVRWYPGKVMESASQSDEEGSSKPKLLIVEDQTDLLKFIESIFIDKFDVITASDGNEGLEKATQKLPDIIITDVMMPIMNGIEMMDKLKNNPVTSHIPVIVLTAKNCDANQIEGYTIGADLYLGKPFNPEVLKAAVNSILTNIERQRRSVAASAGTSEETAIETPQMSEWDRKFLEKLYAYINANISNADLNVNLLGKELGFSRSNFYRKIKALVGVTPNEMLRIYRLNRASEMLKSRAYSIGEIADLTGFATQSHFSSLFKKQFGMTPSEYIHTKKS